MTKEVCNLQTSKRFSFLKITFFFSFQLFANFHTYSRIKFLIDGNRLFHRKSSIFNVLFFFKYNLYGINFF